MNRTPRRDLDELIDPEPVSVMLAILGAVGSIASIYALYDARASVRRAERHVNRNAVRDALMGAETALNDLGGQLRSLELAFEVGARNLDQYHNAIVSFGRVDLFFTGDGYQTWREIQEGVLVSIGRLQRHLGDIMRICSSSDFRLSETTARAMQNFMQEVNAVLHGLSQTSFLNFFRNLEILVANAQTLIRELRFAAYDSFR